jgi:hypothetical protein
MYFAGAGQVDASRRADLDPGLVVQISDQFRRHFPMHLLLRERTHCYEFRADYIAVDPGQLATAIG